MNPPVKTTKIALAIGESDAPLAATMTSLELVALSTANARKARNKLALRSRPKALHSCSTSTFLEKAPEVLGAETSAKFSANLPDSYGRLQPAYIFPKREACLMAMSYSYALQAAVFDHMTALEQELARPTQPPVALPHDFISALEHLLESKKAEQLAIAQRDEAVRTKAQIGSKREATAMATAAAAKRQTDKLKEQLGFCAKHASVIAVEKATGKKFAPQDWRKLRAWCVARGVEAVKVPDARWGEAKAWPAGAWLDVFGVNLGALFGTDGQEVAA